MMPDEMPADPWGPPEEMLAMMRGLAQLHSAAMLAGLSEPTATKFIADVFVGYSMMNSQGDSGDDGNAVT